MWAFVEGKPSIPLKKTSASVWNSSPTVYDDCIYSSFLYDRLWKERLSLTFWMDFGSTELRSNTRKINQLTSLFTNQTLCDVTFTFQKSRQETFGAHTIILSTASPVFAAMFQHDLKEARTRTVHIEDIEPVVFERLLSYMYNSEVGSLDDENFVQNLLAAADKYGIEKLKDQCELRLQSLTAVENVLDILVLADKCSSSKLYKMALEFAETRSKKICFLPSWKELIFKYPDICLELTQRMANKRQII